MRYFTKVSDPGWELAHIDCWRCGEYFVGNENCTECQGFLEPEPTRWEMSEDEIEYLKHQEVIGDHVWCICEPKPEVKES